MFKSFLNDEISNSLSGITRQYLVGNLSKPQKLDFLHSNNLEIGITKYDGFTAEDAHKHTVAIEYQYVLSGLTQYIDISTNEKHEFRKGDFYAIMPETTYAQKSAPGTEILFIKAPSINDKQLVDVDSQIKSWLETIINETPIRVDDNRIMHCLSVARKAAQFSKELMGWDDEKCQEMYTLGYLHDIGYEYASSFEEHPRIGGDLLRRSGYKYWKEVYWHGNIGAEYKSDELDIINLSDLYVDHIGNDVGIDARLLDIQQRYGVNSRQLSEAKKLADSLRVRFNL